MQEESGSSRGVESSDIKSSSSFIYPVKSLLSGIQPARNQAVSSETKPPTSPISAECCSGPACTNIQQSLLYATSAPSCTDNGSDSVAETRNMRSPSVDQLSKTKITSSERDMNNRSSTCSSPARHLPDNPSIHRESGPNSQQSFFSYSCENASSSAPPSCSMAIRKLLFESTESAIIPPVAQTTSETPCTHQSSSTTILESSRYMDTDAKIIATANHTAAYSPSASLTECGVPILPFNPSEYDFVHLSPVAVSASPEMNNKTYSAPTLPTSIISNHSETSDTLTQKSEDESSPTTLSHSGKWQSTSATPAGNDESLTAAADHATFRFQYAQDEYGYHVITGREGQLRRCEDEPIRTPGAVQAFGVLMAIEETEDALIVRQVSENSTELLGLPPSYLFSLSCFTDTLPDSQACLLWDNIPNGPTSTSEDEEGRSRLFLLTGWGAPGTALPDEKNPSQDSRRTWTCWCAVHRTDAPSKLYSEPGSGLIIMEFELERDTFNPLYLPTSSDSPLCIDSTSNGCIAHKSTLTEESEANMDDNTPIAQVTKELSAGAERSINHASRLCEIRETEWAPKIEDIIESTTNYAKPLPALERLRGATRMSSVGSDTRRPRYRQTQSKNIGGMGMMDMFAVMTQINEQFDAAPNLEAFLKVTVGIIKDLTQFHRVLVYQFDEAWNGKVVAELVDWNQNRDLYRGLHFPASDIPAQARELYALNKVRLLYDRAQPTARLIVKSKEDLHAPLNMTHCYLRSMSPIHLKYLENMGVRASMSISISAFGQLWGLVACLGYGDHGMRVSFPVRQMLRLLSQAISRNVERLSYAGRLHTKKLINKVMSERQHSGYIISNADDLLGLFDADFGILVIGEGAKILGPDQYSQEILIIAEYLRLKRYSTIQVSQAVNSDFPDLQPSTGIGLEVISGLLYVPLSNGGKDFIAFLRKGEKYKVHWAGRPYKDNASEQNSVLEPRKSFKVWSEIVKGRCRAWTEEQLETAGVLALVYGKFIEVWRSKAQTKKLTSLLLSNASHEVRTPLNHIINYLELALNGPLDQETRTNLTQSHTASKSLLFTINDLLDLTRLESGIQTSFNEQFNIHGIIEEATFLYRQEAKRRKIEFEVDVGDSPKMVVGDARKVKTVLQNLTANALKYTTTGSVSVRCGVREVTEELRRIGRTTVEIIVADTGCGIPTSKLEMIFREFEQVETSQSRPNGETSVGLGLAVAARNVEQLGGQLRVESKVGEGSRFSFSIPLTLPDTPNHGENGSTNPALATTPSDLFAQFQPSDAKTVDISDRDVHDLLEFLTVDQDAKDTPKNIPDMPGYDRRPGLCAAELVVSEPLKAANLETYRLQRPETTSELSPGPLQLRLLVVEDNAINRAILAKRLRLNGHVVINATNGQEGLAQIEADQAFDAILMDIQMPLLNGFEAAQLIRDFEQKLVEVVATQHRRPSHMLNGRIPIFAVSASLKEKQRAELLRHGLDGWILKPIDFKRLKTLLCGVTDPIQRQKDVYRPGYNWESGGWLKG